MRVTREKIRKVLSIGDIVYAILPHGWGYREAIVSRIGYDSLDTDVDIFFYEDIGELWCLHELTAKNTSICLLQHNLYRHLARYLSIFL